MTWTPRFTAEFEGRLIDNILTLVTRDMKFALDYFYPTENLDDFKERALSYPRGLNFPMLVIDPLSNPTVNVENVIIEQSARFTLEIGVTDSDAERVTRRCMKYMRSGDAVLRTGTVDDYFAGYTAGRYGDLVIDCSHDYSTAAVNPKGLYFRSGSIELVLGYKEL